MLKIGEFSKLSRVSIRTLRRYDEAGLLAPASIDPYTGYRYYSERQLPHRQPHPLPPGHGISPGRGPRGIGVL